MYTMYGQRFERHVHWVFWQVCFSIHGGMVFSCGLPCWLLALVRVQCLVWLHDLRRFVIWWVVILGLGILRP